MKLLGACTHYRLAARAPYGGGVHYASCLPMKDNPQGNYECDRFCELNKFKGVFIADGASFPQLPAKDHGLTLMANAMRVGDRIGTII